MADEDDEIVKTGKLAQVIGVTGETIRQRKKEGVLEEAVRGRYYLAKNVQSYIEYVANGRKTGELSAKKTQVEMERARKLKLENDKAEELLLEADEVREIFATSMITLRQHIEALPARLAPALTGKEDQAEVYEQIDKEVRQALETCARKLESFGSLARPVRVAQTGRKAKS